MGLGVYQPTYNWGGPILNDLTLLHVISENRNVSGNLKLTFLTPENIALECGFMLPSDDQSGNRKLNGNPISDFLDMGGYGDGSKPMTVLLYAIFWGIIIH